jgi:hypothetical protein
MKSTYALLAGIAGFAVAAHVFHYELPTSASPEKILQCTITDTSGAPFLKGHPPIRTPPPFTWTMTYKIVGDQWTAISFDGTTPDMLVRETNAKYGALLNLPTSNESFTPKTTAQTYIIADETKPDGDTNFLSIDRATGAVSGSWHETLGDIVIDGQKTGQCTPVSAM